MPSKYLKAVGARILSEANDLKRTVDSMAIELSIDKSLLTLVVQGQASQEETFAIIDKMEQFYPIDSSDLKLVNDNSKHGVVHHTSDQSQASARVFNRLNSKGEKTPYYEYRDTAMSRLSPFKPEWIKELRLVTNNDPYNADVAYNNGHFMHQMTFFVGPINFYYELNGRKYCEEMNTGDANYITPYIPHSFTTRDPNKEAYIVAITFGGNVRRAQKELYALGASSTNRYCLNIRNPKIAQQQLIKQHMLNENITIDMLKKLIEEQGLPLYTEAIFNDSHFIEQPQLLAIASILNVDVSELSLPQYQGDEEVVISKLDKQQSNFYPSDSEQSYLQTPLARATKMPHFKAFRLAVLQSKLIPTSLMESSYYSYVYNYGESIVRVTWIDDDTEYTVELKPLDSMTFKPFIKHGFTSTAVGKLCIARVNSSINLCTQKELSFFASPERVAQESQCWFN